MSSNNRFPTWMVVVSIVILIPVIVIALSFLINLLVAMSVGGILLIVVIVWIFTKIKDKVDA